MIERLRVRIPAGTAGEYSSPEFPLCADSYSVSFPHPVTAMTRKRPQSFYQKCRWQVASKHAYTLDPAKSELGCYAVRALCGNLSGNELTRNSSGNTQPQSSQLSEALWTGPKMELVCAKWSNLLSQILATEGEKPPPPSPVWTFFFFFFLNIACFALSRQSILF